MGAAQSLVFGTPSLHNIARNALMNRLRKLGSHDGNAEQFHTQILEMFAKINSTMPGVRYDVPGHDKIQALSDKWYKADSEAAKQKLLSELFEEMNPVSSVTIVTGIVAPPAMMLTKRALEKVPKINNVVRFVPDAVFVPISSLASLQLVRVCAKIFQG